MAVKCRGLFTVATDKHWLATDSPISAQVWHYSSGKRVVSQFFTTVSLATFLFLSRKQRESSGAKSHSKVLRKMFIDPFQSN
jgi:hypothetical protein